MDLQHCDAANGKHGHASLLNCLQISAEEFAAAQSDPVAQFAGPIAQHMNADHADSTVAMLRHYIRIDVESASILGLDR